MKRVLKWIAFGLGAWIVVEIVISVVVYKPTHKERLENARQRIAERISDNSSRTNAVASGHQKTTLLLRSFWMSRLVAFEAMDDVHLTCPSLWKAGFRKVEAKNTETGKQWDVCASTFAILGAKQGSQ